MCTREDIDCFHQFALQQIDDGNMELSILDLADLWQLKNLPEAELAESVAAVKASLNDMQNGDCGRPAEEVIAELRQRLETPENR
ncbi:MAG: hypothetical protein HUJ26_22440 [Planctomycetaceae bacterium]|nr:hypothetical protein [Planctomycetaceae bacterium]